jgi:hypothetical protein
MKTLSSIDATIGYLGSPDGTVEPVMCCQLVMVPDDSPEPRHEISQLVLPLADLDTLIPLLQRCRAQLRKLRKKMPTPLPANPKKEQYAHLLSDTLGALFTDPAFQALLSRTVKH